MISHCTSQGLTLAFLGIIISFVIGLAFTLVGVAKQVTTGKQDPLSCYGGLAIMLVSITNMILMGWLLTLN